MGKSYQRQAEEKAEAKKNRKVGDDDRDPKPTPPQRIRGPFAWKAKKKEYQTPILLH